MESARRKSSDIRDLASEVWGRETKALSGALASGRGKVAVAIGTRRFAAVANYFSRCRNTLQLGPTIVPTTLDFLSDFQSWHGCEIWIFGEGTDDPEVAAITRKAKASGAQKIILLAENGSNPVGECQTTEILVVPSITGSPDADLAMVFWLLFASDELIEQPHGLLLFETLESAIAAAYDDHAMAAILNHTQAAAILLCDPLVNPVGGKLEACLRAAGCGLVSRIDFAEFASSLARPAAKFPDATTFVAVTTCETEAMWNEIRCALPGNVNCFEWDCKDGGRFANALGIAKVVMAMRAPNGPGEGLASGMIGASLADLPSFTEFSDGLIPAVEHKMIARLLHDPVNEVGQSLRAIGKARLAALDGAHFVGIALDYDGTLVPNQPDEARFGPPPKAIVRELIRILDNDVAIGIATGRGQSAGKAMRDALPPRLHDRVAVGYFNGSYIQTLDVDIREAPPPAIARVGEMAEWLSTSGLLAPDAHIFSGHAQATVTVDQVIDPEEFVRDLAAAPLIAAGKMRVLRSQHTFDVIPAETTKLAVIDWIAHEKNAQPRSVLAVGDSGSPLGNDREMLSNPHAISVDRVCGSLSGTWSIFGNKVRGPDALLLILQAINAKNGIASIDLRKLQILSR